MIACSSRGPDQQQPASWTRSPARSHTTATCGAAGGVLAHVAVRPDGIPRLHGTALSPPACLTADGNNRNLRPRPAPCLALPGHQQSTGQGRRLPASMRRSPSHWAVTARSDQTASCASNSCRSMPVSSVRVQAVHRRSCGRVADKRSRRPDRLLAIRPLTWTS